MLGGPLRQIMADIFGPLSHRIALGLPRHSMTWSSALMTRRAGREISTSTAKPSLLKSSMTLKVLKLRPSSKLLS